MYENKNKSLNEMKEMNKQKKRSKKNNKNLFVICVVLAVLVVLSVSTAVFCYVTLSGRPDESRYNALYESFIKEKDEKDALSKEYEKTLDEIERLKKELENTDYLKDLEQQLLSVKDELAQKDKEIEELKQVIALLEMYTNIDITAQNELIGKINDLLENGAPKIKVETVDENGNTTVTYEDPIISVYYEDIESGYSYSYNPDTVIRSASCMKAPFALSILSDKKAEESFEDIFTYTESDYHSGSGKIKTMPYGSQFSNYELINYMIRYSDCVAYKHLLKEYGAGRMAALAKSVGAQSIYEDVGAATAPDAGKIMKAIYNYIERGDKYSADFKSWLLAASYRNMIPNALNGKQVAHKYGWDTNSYNDWAIVYDKHPYIITFMSNYDDGGDEFNDYIGKIVKLIDELHSNLYISN